MPRQTAGFAGNSEDMMLKEGRRLRVAREILVRSGVLTQCKTHIDELYLGPSPVCEAYGLAFEALVSGKLNALFDRRVSLAQYVDMVLARNRVGECRICAAIRREKYRRWSCAFTPSRARA